jgi:hypothetical protein
MIEKVYSKEKRCSKFFFHSILKGVRKKKMLGKSVQTHKVFETERSSKLKEVQN